VLVALPEAARSLGARVRLEVSWADGLAVVVPEPPRDRTIEIDRDGLRVREPEGRRALRAVYSKGSREDSAT
jgi:hypothetical protein